MNGRFISPDPLLSSGDISDPQSWNRYTYALNNPLIFTDPLGLYVFDKSVSKDQQDKFNAALAKAKDNLQKIGEKYGTDSNQYKKVARALNAYGDKDVKNGVYIYVEDGPGSGRTQVEGEVNQKTKDNPLGQDIRVGFDVEVANDMGALIEGVVHEGAHVADGTDWVRSGFAESANPREYQFEVDGYTVQSLIDEAASPQGRRSWWLPGYKEKGKNPYYMTTVDLWNSGWAEADKDTMRKANIDKILTRPEKAGGYGLTPTSSKKAFIKGSRFRTQP